MKSDDQHLKTNELSALLTKVVEFFDKYGNQALWGFVAVVVVLSGTIYWQRTSQAKASAVWGRYLSATTAEDFASIADDHAGSVGSYWAQLAEADRSLQMGIQLAFTNRPEGIEDLSELKKAKRAYQSLIDSSAPSKIRERAALGMARYLETVSDGELDDAISAYKRFADQFPDSSQREYADNRIQQLESGDAAKFYAWFFKQNPKPEDRQVLTDGAPQDDLTLPEIPDALIPEGFELPTIESSETPADGNEKSADEKSDDEKTEADKADANETPKGNEPEEKTEAKDDAAKPEKKPADESKKEEAKPEKTKAK